MHSLQKADNTTGLHPRITQDLLPDHVIVIALEAMHNRNLTNNVTQDMPGKKTKQGKKRKKQAAKNAANVELDETDEQYKDDEGNKVAFEFGTHTIIGAFHDLNEDRAVSIAHLE